MNTPASLSIKYALARFNRSKFAEHNELQIATAKPAERNIGRWLLVQRNVIKDAFDTIERLSDYLRENNIIRSDEQLVA